MGAGTVVLVHGAWHGPWAWDAVADGLRQRGVPVRAVRLPSSGDDLATRGDLAADADTVRSTLAGVDGPVVLAGHSYGGIPITQAAADADNVTHLVYVCAFMLDVGESLMAAVGGEDPPWFVPTEEGAAIVPDRPREVFYGDLDDRAAAVAIAQLTPQSRASFTAALTAAGWHDIPSTYLVAEHDQAIPLPAQEAMSQRATAVHRLQTSHSPFLSQPEALVDLFAEISAAV